MVFIRLGYSCRGEYFFVLLQRGKTILFDSIHFVVDWGRFRKEEYDSDLTDDLI